jgi:hypothetical protein
MVRANQKSITQDDPIHLAIERHRNAARLWAAAVAVSCGPGRLNRVSASIGGASAGVRLPCGVAAG